VGLGLAISKAIVDAHGGEIRVRSDEAEGTVFSVKVPAAADPPESAGAARLRPWHLPRGLMQV
jgi:signal transduction histidine kinase